MLVLTDFMLVLLLASVGSNISVNSSGYISSSWASVRTDTIPVRIDTREARTNTSSSRTNMTFRPNNYARTNDLNKLELTRYQLELTLEKLELTHH